jgi:hypothetical protein
MVGKFSSEENRIGVRPVDSDMTISAILIPGIGHVVLGGRVWIASAMQAEVTRPVMAFQTNCKDDRPL